MKSVRITSNGIMLLVVFGSIAAVVLTGCNSFNETYVHIEEAKANHHQQPDAAKYVEPVDKAQLLKKAKCELYILPEVGPTPEIPLDKLNALSKTDVAGLEQLERQYIIELREYIIALKRDVHDSYHGYVDECIKATIKK